MWERNETAVIKEIFPLTAVHYRISIYSSKSPLTVTLPTSDHNDTHTTQFAYCQQFCILKAAVSTETRQSLCFIFYILLTVHLDAILGNEQLDALFLNAFISYASTCFEQQVLIIRRTKLY
jgi:hypothetical protein